MSTSWDTFERHKQKGLDARRAGQWDSARIYLLEAARAMLELSKQAQGGELVEARRETAAKLLELAKDCEKAKTENRRQFTGPARINLRLRIHHFRRPMARQGTSLNPVR